MGVVGSVGFNEDSNRSMYSWNGMEWKEKERNGCWLYCVLIMVSKSVHKYMGDK